MAGPLKPEEVAKFAAEGVAIALTARDPNYRRPVHIICGLPLNKEMFRVEITADQAAPCPREISRSINQADSLMADNPRADPTGRRQLFCERARLYGGFRTTWRGYGGSRGAARLAHRTSLAGDA